MKVARVDLGGVVLWTGGTCAVLALLPDTSIDCVVPSPPYWGLRDYGMAGQYGREDTLEDYVGHLRVVFAELRRVLEPTGTVWLNLGDSSGSGTTVLAARRLGREAIGIDLTPAFHVIAQRRLAKDASAEVNGTAGAP
ncbi:DNA methyltransferase [Actinoallomurus rhizosphaericola]|uniref:DNA methyltransferase n=1 Tax=Actinoallomurus rhizosphaericola TaxID=2952536 RepID=UPI002092DE5B|nr:DNA methyltransferase [Actinoallomurus rhizosphaericola]MCO5998459.1 site-specific DNA-methyltransferase [Actinoallomurus rhizosphaericola]